MRLCSETAGCCVPSVLPAEDTHGAPPWNGYGFGDKHYHGAAADLSGLESGCYHVQQQQQQQQQPVHYSGDASEYGYTTSTPVGGEHPTYWCQPPAAVAGDVTGTALVAAAPVIGPYDICELRVYSLHQLQHEREAVRIIALAAGESLHNIYRVIMTSLGQREDRARLVFHAWVLPDGRVFGNGPRYREVLTSMGNDRELYLNQLPIHVGYELEFVFGKCAYVVVIEDIFEGLTDEQDLVWTPRVCEGSYGEPVPFDLCYFPHLFRRSSSLDIASPHAATTAPPCNADPCCPNTAPAAAAAGTSDQDRLRLLRPVHDRDQYLSTDELDEINRHLSKMRFIRQHSQIKPLLRKYRPEDYISNDTLRRQCFRMTPRRFFCYLWTQQFVKQHVARQSSPFPSHPVFPLSFYHGSQTSTASSSSPTEPSTTREHRFGCETTTTTTGDERPSAERPGCQDDSFTTTTPATVPPHPPQPILPVLWNVAAAATWESRSMGRTGHYFPRCRVSKRVESTQVIDAPVKVDLTSSPSSEEEEEGWRSHPSSQNGAGSPFEDPSDHPALRPPLLNDGRETSSVTTARHGDATSSLLPIGS